MRIFYDHQVFSLHDAGGAARYHYELIAHLQCMPDIEIEAVLGFHNSIFPFSTLKAPNTRIFGSRAQFLSGVPRYLFNEALATSVAAARCRYDIYHPTLYRAMPLVPKKRIVVTHHDCAHERFPHMFRNASLVIRNKRRLYAQCDAVICVSESGRQDLLQFYDLDKSRTFVVHHGFTPFSVEHTSDEQVESAQRPYVLYVGFRGTYKNFNLLLQAYSISGLAKNYDLLAVGGGDFSADELGKIKSLGLCGRVRDMQRVDDATLARLYRNAAVFVYPSLHEGFGFPPLEAMSMGCPVVASSVSSIPEVCGDAALLFDPADANSLSRALRLSLTDTELRNTLKARGYNRIRCFSWAKAAEQTFRIYESVLKESS